MTLENGYQIADNILLHLSLFESTSITSDFCLQLPNIKVSVLLLLCSMISFLFILGVLDNLIFGSLLVSSAISGTIQFKTLFFLFIRVIL